MTDEQLLIQAKKGKQSAIAQLYDRYVKAIYRFCWYQLHDEERAQDLTQDVFIEMIHSLKSFHGKGSFKNWLYVIAKRQVLHFLREKYKLPKTSLGDWIPGDSDCWIDPDEEVQLEYKDTLVRSLLTTLKVEEQQILTLVYLQNYTSKEAAAVTGRTPESIRVTLHRILKKLRKQTKR